MIGLTRLQEDLKPAYLRRDFHDVMEVFDHFGENLQGAILSPLIMDCNNPEPVCVADVGCASGDSVEEALRSAMISASNMGIQRRIEGVGVDVNPLDSIDPGILKVGSEIGLDDKRIATIKKGDFCELPLENNSVDVLYSVATLMYVRDRLKALEEIYRVLKSGGVAMLDVISDETFLSPGWDCILGDTAGACDIFNIVKSPEDKGAMLIVVNKKEGDSFTGFPFQFSGGEYLNLSADQIDVNPILQYYFRAQYKKVLGEGCKSF